MIEFAVHLSDRHHPLPQASLAFVSHCICLFICSECYAVEEWAVFRVFPVFGCCKEGC